MKKESFGVTADGEAIDRYTLKTGAAGLVLTVTNYGATTLDLEKKGRDIILGHEDVQAYFSSPTYYGMSVLPCANRIADGSFQLEGVTYHTDKNDGNNTNHSGFHALCNRLWQVTEAADDHIRFSYDAPDGDMGFPGNRHFDVTYRVTEDEVVIDYHATSDRTTICNPTNHSYFNLKGHGEGDILDHMLCVYADEMTYANEQSLPDGTIRPVRGTPFDFTEARRIGERIDEDYDMLRFGRGYDHNFILRGETDERARCLSAHGKSLQRAVSLIAPDEALRLDVYTDLPGVQIYTGNYIPEGSRGKDGKRYCRRGGVAIETQFYPNAMNIPDFPQPVLHAGEDFYSRSVYVLT